jgi:cysteine-rich repeat protein
VRLWCTVVTSIFVALQPAAIAWGWQTVVDGTPGGSRPFAVALDVAGDVLVAGRAATPDDGDDGLVVKLSAADGHELWRWQVDGTAHAADQIRAVAIDRERGEVAVTGRVADVTAGGDLLVARLSADGTVLWSRALDGGAGGADEGFAVLVTGDGDVVAAGRTVPAGGIAQFSVLRLSRLDGAVLWQRDLGGSGEGGSSVARRLAFGAAGEIVAAGRIRNATTGDDMLVVSLDADTGTPLWRTEIGGDGTGAGGGGPGDEDGDDDLGGADDAVALGIGPTGEIAVAGHLTNAAMGIDFTVVVLSPAGGERWRVALDGAAHGAGDDDRAFAVAVDAAGDVIAAGRLVNDATGSDFALVKLDGAGGAVAWRQELDGADGGSDDLARALALDDDGDVVAVGRLGGRGTRRDLALTAFAGADGALRWRVAVDGAESRNDEGFVVAVDAAGDVVAAGRTRNGEGASELTVVKRSGPGGGSFPCGDGHLQAGEQCDDGNPRNGDGCRPDCTVEACGDGILDPQEDCDDGNPSDGDCCSRVCEPAADGTPCDDGNACTAGDECTGGVCKPGAPLLCLPSSSCHIAFCDALSAGCAETAKANGIVCSDGDACTVGDACRGGTCVAGAPRPCDDGDACTQDGCDPDDGCVHLPHGGFQSVSCALEDRFVTPSCPVTGPPAPRNLARRVERLATKIDKAAAAGEPRKARRLLKGAARSARKASRLAGVLSRKGKLSPGCSAAFAAGFADVEERARRLGSAL